MKIGLVGRMHSGKGEVARYLVERHGFRQVAFADPVKDASVAALNAALVTLGREPVMDRATLERDKAALRALPQFIGTEFGRQYLGDPDIWIDILRDRVNDPRFLPEHNVVVDDCRFPNEAAALQDAGFTVVLVRRPCGRTQSIEQAIRAANPGMPDDEVLAKREQAMAHPSETDVDQITADAVIHNLGTIAELGRKVDDLLAYLGGRDG